MAKDEIGVALAAMFGPDYVRNPGDGLHRMQMRVALETVRIHERPFDDGAVEEAARAYIEAPGQVRWPDYDEDIRANVKRCLAFAITAVEGSGALAAHHSRTAPGR